MFPHTALHFVRPAYKSHSIHNLCSSWERNNKSGKMRDIAFNIQLTISLIRLNVIPDTYRVVINSRQNESMQFFTGMILSL